MGCYNLLMLLFVRARKGAYWRALHLARHLVRRGHRVTLMAMSPQNRWRFHVQTDSGLTLVETPDLLWGPLRSGWDPWDSLRRVLWLRDRPFDLVHAFDARPTVLLPALYLQARRRVPLVMDWEDWFGRGGAVEERPNPLVRALLRPVETFFEERFRTRVDGTTVICSTLRHKAIALGVPPETILLLPDGADVEGLRPLAREACRRELGLPPAAPIVGYVGAIFRRDARLMAQAFDQLRARLPQARLLLIGYVNQRLEAMVQTPQAVIRTGFVDYAQMNRYLCACDLCWLPLRDSGANRGRWPMKLNDYMCAGRPTVATAVGDVTPVMETWQLGLLAPDEPQALAHQSLILLDDPQHRDWLGQNARQVAQAHFDWRLRTDELETFYEKILARGAHLPL